MRNIFYLFIVAVIIITACQPKVETLKVDLAAEKDSISKNLDLMYTAYSNKDAKTYLSILSDDCFSCGTDPKEWWDRAEYSKIITESFADTSYVVPVFTIDTREIRMNKDGNSAIVIEQFYIKGWSDKIPLRNVTHHVKTDNKWLCDFNSIGFVPQNQDLTKIFNSLKE